MRLLQQFLDMTEQHSHKKKQNQLQDIFRLGHKMKKGWILIGVEIIGLAIASVGLLMVSVPVALIGLGGFIVWITERASE